jgi:hypothetical protein
MKVPQPSGLPTFSASRLHTGDQSEPQRVRVPVEVARNNSSVLDKRGLSAVGPRPSTLTIDTLAGALAAGTEVTSGRICCLPISAYNIKFVGECRV